MGWGSASASRVDAQSVCIFLLHYPPTTSERLPCSEIVLFHTCSHVFYMFLLQAYNSWFCLRCKHSLVGEGGRVQLLCHEKLPGGSLLFWALEVPSATLRYLFYWINELFKPGVIFLLTSLLWLVCCRMKIAILQEAILIMFARDVLLATWLTKKSMKNQ